MNVRDMYISLLEKRASGDAGCDSAEVAQKEQASNRKDHAHDLKVLFDNAGKAEKEQSSFIGKTLPDSKSGDSSTSNPLLKVALNQAFFDGVRRMGIFKEASPDYLHSAYNAFSDEISKIWR